MSAKQRLSHVAQRIAQRRRFSRSPLAGSELVVRLRPSDAQLDPDYASVLSLSMHRWGVYRDTLFASFEATPQRGAPTIRSALVLFSTCAVEVPLDRAGAANVAVPVPATHAGNRCGLAFELASGRTVVVWEPGRDARDEEPTGFLLGWFRSRLELKPTGRILEIGSRAREGAISYREIVVPETWTYVGMDVRPGPNVDVVGDAHQLSTVFAGEKFDAVFSVSVFEHLLMPWKVAVEINRVLEPDGFVFVSTHQSFPLHDQPWDFWRYSDRAWSAIFNVATGFRIVDTALGETASIVPHIANDATWATGDQPAFMSSAMTARKTGDPTVDWPVDVDELLGTEDKYPR